MTLETWIKVVMDSLLDLELTRWSLERLRCTENHNLCKGDNLGNNSDDDGIFLVEEDKFFKNFMRL